MNMGSVNGFFRCHGQHPSCASGTTIVSTLHNPLDVDILLIHTCAGCRRARMLKVSERDFPDHYNSPREHAHELGARLSLPNPPPFGAGPAIQGIK